jgi:hypothetical protein
LQHVGRGASMSTLAQGTPNGPTKAGATRTIWRALVVPNAKQGPLAQWRWGWWCLRLRRGGAGRGGGGGGLFSRATSLDMYQVLRYRGSARTGPTSEATSKTKPDPGSRQQRAWQAATAGGRSKGVPRSAQPAKQPRPAWSCPSRRSVCPAWSVGRLEHPRPPAIPVRARVPAGVGWVGGWGGGGGQLI